MNRHGKNGMRWASAAAGLVLAAIGATGAASEDALETCAPESGDSRLVVSVIDAETVGLDDGSTVRLMGARAPWPHSLAVDVETWPPAKEAARALEALVLNRDVTLHYDGRRKDRYGRRLAQLALRGSGALQERWIQYRLVADGYARAYALPGNTDCLGALVAAENEARQARRGLWNGGRYRDDPASDVAALLRRVGRFAVVEGRVAAVARTRRYTYVNFDADWRKDFTISLRTSAVDRSEEGEARAKALEGRKVRARGWIERRNGPMIEVSGLDEIEVVDEPAADPATGTAQEARSTDAPQ